MDEQKRNEFREEDLERYGVWVKAGPEEVVDADDDFAFADLPAEATPDVPNGDASSDEGYLSDQDDELDIPDIEDLDLDDIGDDEVTGDISEADDDDLVSLDDLELEEPDGETDPFSVLEDNETTAASSPDTDGFDGADLSDPEELTLPDDFDEPEELSLSEEDDLSFPTDLSEPEELSIPEDLSEPEAADTGDDDFDLDALTDSLDDDFEELEIESPEIADAPSDDADSMFDSTIPGSDDELEDIDIEEFGSDDSDSEDLPELTVENEHDFTPEDQGIEIVPQTPANQITPDEEEFLTAEEDLQNGDESAIPRTMDTQEREAFDRIQTELKDIKRELAELKQALRAGAAAQPTPQASDEPAQAPFAADDDTSDMPTLPDMEGLSASDEEETFVDSAESDDDEARPSGFFEEDEDETIALTGDELDNILNTAEFTELAGETEELEDDYLVDNAEEHAEQPSEPISEIEMEPVDDAEDLFDDDDPAVSELADMDIDQELSDIESLSDESSDEEATDPDEIEIDLDALDEIGEPEQEEEEEAPADDEEDFDAFASAVEQDIAGTELDEVTIAPEEDNEVADIDEIELDDDFEDESEPEEPEESVDETPEADDEEIELDLDDLEVEDIDLDDGTSDTTDEHVSETLEESESPLEETPVESEEFVEEVVPAEQEGQRETEEQPTARSSNSIAELPEDLKQEIRSVLSYMDQLLEALPDDKIEEFAQSEHFDVYKRLFEELGLET